MMDIVLNLIIFLAAPLLLIGSWIREWDKEAGKMKVALRFFTCQSNILCSFSALAMTVAHVAGNVPEWVWLLKYIGTAGVTLTMLTVFLFLAPSIGKNWYEVLLKGASNLFMHLLTPLMALISFCILEKRGMSFEQSLWGMLPVLLYAPLYLYRVVLAPPGKRWDDFYGFNKDGRWPLMLSVMLAGMFCICMLLMLAQNG